MPDPEERADEVDVEVPDEVGVAQLGERGRIDDAALFTSTSGRPTSSRRASATRAHSSRFVTSSFEPTRRPAEGLDRLRQRVCLHVRRDDGGAVLDARPRDGRPEPARGTRHQDGLAAQEPGVRHTTAPKSGGASDIAARYRVISPSTTVA